MILTWLPGKNGLSLRTGYIPLTIVSASKDFKFGVDLEMHIEVPKNLPKLLIVQCT